MLLVFLYFSVKIELYEPKFSKTSKQVKGPIPFENDLISLKQNIRFRNTRNDFQNKLRKDIQLIKSSDKTVTFTDKTRYLSRLAKAECYLIMKNAITLKDKKTSSNIKKQISIDGKKFLKNKEVLNLLEIYREKKSLITLNDQKEYFNINPTLRLKNPAKNELVRISKAILAMNLNQSRNTDTVIDRFNSIHIKYLYGLVIFDIKEFYPPFLKDAHFSQMTERNCSSRKEIIIFQQSTNLV